MNRHPSFTVAPSRAWWLILPFAIFAGCSRKTPPASNQQPSPETTAAAPDTSTGLSETSTNFDTANVRPFLQRLSGKLPGFTPEYVDRLSEGISKAPVDSERAWVITIEHAGESVPLRIRVFMDDVDSPDLYFYSVPGVSAIIGRELESFAKEKGL